MKVKNFIRNERSLLIIFMIFLVAIILTGCKKTNDEKKVYDKENEVIQNTTNQANEIETNEVNGNTKDNTLENNVENQVTNNLIKDSSKKIVYALYTVEDSYDVPYGEGKSYQVKYKYKIPQINMNSEDAERINGKILELLKPTYDDYQKLKQSGCSKIEYAYHKNGNVLSLVIAEFWDGGSIERQAYNINMETGKEVTNAELLQKKGISQTEFPSKLSNILNEKFKGMYTPSAEMSDPDTVEIFNAQYKRTIALENCSTTNEMYLNANNDLCVIVTRYNVAGPGSTKIIVNMDTNSIFAQES